MVVGYKIHGSPFANLSRKYLVQNEKDQVNSKIRKIKLAGCSHRNEEKKQFKKIFENIIITCLLTLEREYYSECFESYVKDYHGIVL